MQLLERSLAAFLCLSLTAPPVSGWSQEPSPTRKPADAKPRAPYQSGQLHGDERILHAMNRFTFGPRPGDLDVVRSIGLDNWFEQQLHPASLDLTDLNARLAEFPAMQWNPEDLLFRIPSNAIIRQVINGKAPVPERGVLHAIYEDQIYRVTEKKQEQAQKKEAELNKAAPAAAPTTPAMNPNMAMDGQAERAENPTPLSKDPNANQANSSEAGQMNMSASQPANAGPVY
ncbi:MAG: DUF1800 family protein, partial [Terracidiphilus sp.]